MFWPSLDFACSQLDSASETLGPLLPLLMASSLFMETFYCSFFEIESYFRPDSVAQADFELLAILLPQRPGSWDYRHKPP